MDIYISCTCDHLPNWAGLVLESKKVLRDYDSLPFVCISLSASPATQLQNQAENCSPAADAGDECPPFSFHCCNYQEKLECRYNLIPMEFRSETSEKAFLW